MTARPLLALSDVEGAAPVGRADSGTPRLYLSAPDARERRSGGTVDTAALGAVALTSVRVRIPPPAQAAPEEQGQMQLGGLATEPQSVHTLSCRFAAVPEVAP